MSGVMVTARISFVAKSKKAAPEKGRPERAFTW
jgi:hypothetical protein